MELKLDRMEKSMLKEITDFRNKSNTKDEIIKELTDQLEEKNAEQATNIRSQSKEGCTTGSYNNKLRLAI